ncbi:MAG: DUF885 domain-containing protein [Gammaproteobacteria bacterium]
MNLRNLLALVATVLIAACGGDKTQDARDTAAPPGDAAREPAAVSESQGEALNRLTEAYFEESLKLNPLFATFVGDNRYNDRIANDIGPGHRAAERELYQRYLDALGKIDEASLEGQDRLTYLVFERDLSENLEGFRFPSHLIPVNQFYGMHNSFARLGSGAGLHPFRTVKDYDDFLSRSDDFVIWIDQAITNMKEGAKKDVVQPRILMERVVPQLEALIKDEPEQTVFWKPVENMPEEFAVADRDRLTAAYRDKIATTVMPAYRRLLAYVQDSYLASARETVGLNALPDGEAWYAYRVRSYTTTDLSPDEIHEIGLAEVARIHGQMQAVIDEVGFEGSLQDFFAFLNDDPRFYFDSEEELLTAYRSLMSDLDVKALKLFDRLPRTGYEIRPVESYRAKSASGGSYVSPSPDGSRPGVFYVNTYDLSARPRWGMESLFLHEAVPGHHFQNALAIELTDLPRLRRFGGYTAYGEGWGLYAESLGKELGVYQDSYQYFGALAAELWRAIRLVVDTGLHHKSWSREQVLEFMYSNTAVKEARAVSEAERYIAIPGQALAYKIGQLQIRSLRDEAEAAWGDDFDVKAFHRQVLDDGELPLDVLAAKIRRWNDERGSE